MNSNIIYFAAVAIAASAPATIMADDWSKYSSYRIIEAETQEQAQAQCAENEFLSYSNENRKCVERFIEVDSKYGR